jgi:hypothetical protein
LSIETNGIPRIRVNGNGNIQIPVASSAATPGLMLRQTVASQPNDFLTCNDNTGKELFSVDSDGHLNIGPSGGAGYPNSPICAIFSGPNIYLQEVIQNRNSGNASSSDFVAVADNGTDTTFYIDLGINSSTYSDAAYNITRANDSYLIAVGGDLVITTATAGKIIRFGIGGTTTANVEMILGASTLTMSNQIISNVTDPVLAQDVATKNYVDSRGGPLLRRRYGASDFDEPNNNNWVRTGGIAALTNDTLNPALSVRRFDDTAEEGVGFDIYVPSGASNVKFTFVHRAETAPTGATIAAMPVVFGRLIFDYPTGPGNWAGASGLVFSGGLPIQSGSTGWHYDSRTIPIVSLGVPSGTANRVVQFELTRRGTFVTDNLVGDWDLLTLLLEAT